MSRIGQRVFRMLRWHLASAPIPLIPLIPSRNFSSESWKTLAPAQRSEIFCYVPLVPEP